MKSHIISLADYRGLLEEPYAVELYDDELGFDAELELKKLCLLSKKQLSIDNVQKGDVAELKLCSAEPKFKREHIALNVGLGLFSAELEQSLTGRSVGDKFTVTVGESTVEVSILSARRTVIPEPDDDFVKTLGIDGVETVAQFNDYQGKKHLDELLDGYADFYAGELFAQWMEKSEIYIDEQEFNSYLAEWKKILEEADKAHGTTMLENYEGEIEEMNRADTKSFLLMSVIACFFEGEDIAEFELKLTQPELERVRNKALSPLKKYALPRLKVIDRSAD